MQWETVAECRRETLASTAEKVRAAGWTAGRCDADLNFCWRCAPTTARFRTRTTLGSSTTMWRPGQCPPPTCPHPLPLPRARLTGWGGGPGSRSSLLLRISLAKELLRFLRAASVGIPQLRRWLATTARLLVVRLWSRRFLFLAVATQALTGPDVHGTRAQHPAWSCDGADEEAFQRLLELFGDLVHGTLIAGCA